MTELVTVGETPLQFSPPGSERLEMATEAQIYADGTESNVAVAAHELGAETLWVSKVPDSPLGRRVVTQLEEQRIQTDVTWVAANDVRQGLVFRESSAPPRNSKRWHDRDGTAMAEATPADFPMDVIKDASILFAGMSTAVLSQSAADTVGALMRAAGGSGAVTALSLDYHPAHAPAETYRGVLSELSPHTDVFFANESKARQALDRSGGPRELANVIAADNEFDIVVITRSEHGAVALHDSPGTNVIHERETIPNEAVDPTGQHGAFIGAFLQQLIAGSDTARALTHAVATAVFARTTPGPFLTLREDELDPLVEEVIDRSQ